MKATLALLCSTCMLLLAACGGGGGGNGGGGSGSVSPPPPPIIGTPVTFDISGVKNGHLGGGYKGFINVFGSVTSLTISGQLPPGIQATIGQPASVTLTGIPTQTGSFQFTLQAVGKPGISISENQNVTIIVDTALAIVEVSMDAGVVGMPYQFQLHHANGAPPYAWSYQPLITGITMDAATGLVSGVPTYTQGNIEVTVTDSSSPTQTATQSIFFPVNFPLSQNSSAFTAFLRTPFNSSLGVGGGQFPLLTSVISGSLPPGISLNLTSGQFSGAPIQIGIFPFTIQVQDSATPPQLAQFSDTISVTPPPLSLSSDSFPTLIPQGVPLDIFLAANGGTPPYSFTLTQGTLPAGLSLNHATGQISGTPSQRGDYSFQVSVRDTSNPVMRATGSFGTTVRAALGRNDVVSHATPLNNGYYQASISPYSDPVGSPNPAPDQDYYQVSSMSGSVLTIALNTGSFDPVLEIVDANGQRLSTCRPNGAPQPLQQPCLAYHVQPGLPGLDVQVAGAPNTLSEVYAHVLDYRGDARPDFSYYISVSGVVSLLQVTSSNAGFDVGRPAYAQMTATGGSGQYAWQVVSGAMPPGVTISAAGQITGIATLTGSYPVTVSVTDSANPPQIASGAVTFTVANPPQMLTTSMPDAKVGVPYQFTFICSGGIPPYQWGFVGITPNLTFAGSTLAGTPTTPGTYPLMVSCVDSATSAGAANGNFSLIVDP